MKKVNMRGVKKVSKPPNFKRGKGIKKEIVEKN